VVEDIQELELLCTAGEKVIDSLCGKKTAWQFLTKIKQKIIK